MEDDGGPGPPDTGQFTETASLVRGSLDIINTAYEEMQVEGPVTQNINNNKRPYVDETGNTQNKQFIPDVSGINVNSMQVSGNSFNVNGSNVHSSNFSSNIIVPNTTGSNVNGSVNGSNVNVNNSSSSNRNAVNSQNQNISNKSKSANNKYKLTDSGPYYVFVENINNKRLHPMAVGKILFKTNAKYKEHIVGEISSVGKFKVRLQINNAIIANNLTNFEPLNTNGLEAYIPEFSLYRQGIVKYVDTEITDEEFVSEVVSNIKVISCRRLTRRIKVDDNFTNVKSQTCAIKFEGQKLPEYIYLYGTRCEVTPYIPSVIQCFNCLRYGHMKNSCKSSIRCSRCQERHQASECPEKDPRCAFCKGSHSSIYRKCPEYSRQVNIKKLMVLNNMSYAQASRLQDSSYSSAVKDYRPSYNTDFPKYTNPQVHSNTFTSGPSTSGTNMQTSKNIQPKKHFNITRRYPAKSNNNNNSATIRQQFPCHNVSNSVGVQTIDFNPYSPSCSTAPSATVETNNIQQSSMFSELKDKLSTLVQNVVSDTSNNKKNVGNQNVNRFLDNTETSSINHSFHIQNGL